MPSIEEQQAIVDHIRRETRDLNTAVARTEREIALMQEYRTRLTADLVTGKLDVRSAAAKLPATLDATVAEPASEDPLEDIADEEVEA
jgi:type I restriction enzyme S subunit